MLLIQFGYLLMHRFKCIFLIYFSNGQMVNTRSGGGQDVPPVIRAHIANQQNLAPPPPVNQAMDPAMQQFFEAQMQLIQNLTNTVQQMQAQQN
jgi:hypothetical protein